MHSETPHLSRKVKWFDHLTANGVPNSIGCRPVSLIFWQSPGYEAQLTELVISKGNSH